MAWNWRAQPWLGGHQSLENVQKRLLGNVLPRAFFSFLFFFAFMLCTEVLPGCERQSLALCNVCAVQNKPSKLRKGEGENGENMHAPNQKQRKSVGKRRFGNEFLSTNELRCLGGSPSPCSSSFFPATSSPLPLGGSCRGGFAASRALSSG